MWLYRTTPTLSPLSQILQDAFKKKVSRIVRKSQEML